MSWLGKVEINDFGGGIYAEFLCPCKDPEEAGKNPPMRWKMVGNELYHFGFGRSKLHALLRLQQKLKDCSKCRRLLAPENTSSNTLGEGG